MQPVIPQIGSVLVLSLALSKSCSKSGSKSGIVIDIFGDGDGDGDGRLHEGAMQPVIPQRGSASCSKSGMDIRIGVLMRDLSRVLSRALSMDVL